MAHEEWRDIPGYEGYYQASTSGNIRGLSRLRRSYVGTLTQKVSERMLHPTKVKNGYLVVRLSKDGVGKNSLVHRLVAETFIPNPDNKPCVDHINADRADNRLENLRWVTYDENNENMLRLGNGVKWEDRRFTKASADAMRANSRRAVVRSDGKFYKSVIDAAIDLGYRTSSMVTKMLNGYTDNVRGYTFRYATEEEVVNAGCIKVLQIDPKTNRVIRYFNSGPEAVRILGNTGILNCLSGRNELSGGYRWEYGPARQ